MEYLRACGHALVVVVLLETSEGGCQGGWELKVSGGELKGDWKLKEDWELKEES
jgi:hypothetical protein